MRHPLEHCGPFSWETFQYYWSDRLSDFGLDGAHLTVEADIPEIVRIPKQVIWRRTDMTEDLVALNHAILHDGVPQYYPRYEPRGGILDTIRLLMVTDGNAEANCALLVLASLHPRFESTRRHGSYRDKIIPYELYSALSRTCRDVLESLDLYVPWGGWNTDCLPVKNDDDDYLLKSHGAVARYFAEEHAANFCQYAAIKLIPTATLDPELVSGIAALEAKFEAERRARAERHEQWRREQEQARETEAVARKERLRTVNAKRAKAGYSPLEDFKIWHAVGKNDLRRLLWSMPVTFIADEYGVSDVAVHKAAKSWGLQKPPQGFWNRVHAGTEPHPKGVPPKG